jgi:type IV pilus assembly protein PilQ
MSTLESVMSRKLQSLSIPLLLATCVSATAHASGSDSVDNRIGTVTVEETADHTVIRIEGEISPTYSVYRLRNPLRLFVDVSNSELAAEGATIDVYNGVVSQVATVEYDDTLTQVARVVIGFERDATYDVTAEGDTLVVTVDGTGRRAFVADSGATMGEEAARLASELAASRDRIAALEQAQMQAEARAAVAESEALTAQIARETAEQERLRALAAQAELGASTSAMQLDYDAQLATLAAERTELELRLSALEQTNTSTAASDISALQAELASLASEAEGVRAAQREQSQVIADQQSEIARLSGERDAAVAAVAEQVSTIDDLRAQWEATPTAAPMVATGPVTISDVRFEQVDGVDRIIIEVPAGAEFTSEPWSDDRSSITFAGAVLPDALQRTLDTQAFEGAVGFVSSYTDPDGQVRIVSQLQNAASEVVRQEADRIVWEFMPAAAFSPTETTVATSAAPQTASTTIPVATNSYGEDYGTGVETNGSLFQRRPRMTRKRITIDLRNADIQNVLRLLAEEGNLNIVASDAVMGTVTLRLRSVPLDDALTIILRSKGLGWEQEGNILRVAPLTEFEAEYESQLQRLADSFGLEPLQVRLIPVNYAEATAMAGLVGGVLSSRGSVSVDARNNMLVVTDIFSHLETAQALAAQLDNQTPQILIEARIVETNDQFRRQLGIQWGGDYLADQSIGNATGLLFPSTVGIAGGATDGQTPTAGGSTQPNYAVNLPAPAGTGEGGAIGFTFGSLAGSFNLNVRLSAAESEGSAKIISAPRIMTLDNVGASITSGVSIPVSVVSAAGAQTSFVDASLTLDVTPRVTPDGFIFLEVNISKNEPDFENTGSRGDPSIIRREARTQLLIRDGDTTVIGGIFQRNTGFSTSRVPFFGSLPVIGPLFRNSSRTDVRNELLVFITPRIVNRDLSIDQYGAGPDIVRPDED